MFLNLYTSLLPRLHAPPSKKQSGEQSQVSWAYYPNIVMTNEIVRSVIITYTFLITVKFVHLHSSICTFFERVCCKMLLLLGYIVAKACTSPRNSTWFTRPFLLVRGWGLGTRLPLHSQQDTHWGILLLIWSAKQLASFPGPAQLSVASSTKKRGEPGIFLTWADVIRNRKMAKKHFACSSTDYTLNARYIWQSPSAS